MRGMSASFGCYSQRWSQLRCASEIGRKSVLASHFRALWSVAHCFDLLECIIRVYGPGGQWPEIWLSIKKTLHYDSARLLPDPLSRLKALEGLTAPSNILAEIRSYAFLDPWRHSELHTGGYEEKMEKIQGELFTLESSRQLSQESLPDLGAEIWEAHSNALLWLERLAKGSKISSRYLIDL